MFREMRRGKRALTEAEAKEILYGGTSGVLALSGDDDYPCPYPMCMTGTGFIFTVLRPGTR